MADRRICAGYYKRCEGKRQAKFKRQTQMRISEPVIESYEAEGFCGPMRKETTRPADGYDDRHRPRAATDCEYAKTLCEQYSFLLRKYQLCVAEERYIGISRDDCLALKENLLYREGSCRVLEWSKLNRLHKNLLS